MKVHRDSSPQPEPPVDRHDNLRVVHGPATAPRRRFRVANSLIIICCAIGVAAALHFATQSGVAWVHHQPEYETAFRDILIRPAPLPYIRSGAAGLLEQVRRNSNREERLRTQGLDLTALARDFALGSPWVERVDSVRVQGQPNQVVVNLSLREPLATIRWGGLVIVDRAGVVLPNDDIDATTLPPLVDIRGIPPHPSVPLAGRGLLKAGAPGEQALMAALKLANFVRNHSASRQPNRFSFRSIDASNGPQWLSLHTADRYRIAWGEAPGEESPGRPSARQKWDWLVAWLAREQLTPEERETRFLAFTRDGIEILSDAQIPANPRRSENPQG